MANETDMVPVIYIAGYGRSGSTLLERILAAHPEIWGLGELTSFHREVVEDCLCACGEKVRTCPFWSNVIRDCKLDDPQRCLQLRRRQRQHESIFGLWRLLCRGRGRRAYIENTKQFFTSLHRHLPESIRFVIDSSKTSRSASLRPILLSRLGGLDIRMIHIVRDGRGCTYSNVKGDNRMMEQGLANARRRLPLVRTAINWPLANAWAQIFRLVCGRRSYLRIRYEDFVSQPETVLRQVGEFLGMDFSEQIANLLAGQSIPLSHQVSGNRLRTRKDIVLRPDTDWQTKLKGRYKLAFLAVNWPWMLAYGYLGRCSPRSPDGPASNLEHAADPIREPR
ncbi:MAG: sulfotransferase [Phycisphaeraceae bacterium]